MFFSSSNQNLTMLGIDVIVEKGTGHHVVVDINYFPGKFCLSFYIPSDAMFSLGSLT